MKRFTQKSDETSRMVERSIYNALQNYQIAIPQIAVGEVFAMLPKHIEGQQNLINMLNKLWTSLEELLDKNFRGLLPITEDGIDILKRIREYEHGIEPTDTVIIAQAASDPRSEFLLSLDRAILSSNGLRKFVKELVKMGKRKTPLRFLESL